MRLSLEIVDIYLTIGRSTKLRFWWQMPANRAADPFSLEQFREYLNILALQQVASRFQGKVDLSGVVQETLWEAHQQLQRGKTISPGGHLPWLRRILINNFVDAARKMQTAKRNVNREVSFQQSVEQSSLRLEAWLACDMPPHGTVEQEEVVLKLVAASVRCHPTNEKPSPYITGAIGR